MEKYIEVRIYKSGRITLHKSTESEYEACYGGMYSRLSPKKEYDFFITSNKRLKRDCKRHLGRMQKTIDKEQAILDKKRAHINKMINNSKEL